MTEKKVMELKRELFKSDFEKYELEQKETLTEEEIGRLKKINEQIEIIGTLIKGFSNN